MNSMQNWSKSFRYFGVFALAMGTINGAGQSTATEKRSIATAPFVASPKEQDDQEEAVILSGYVTDFMAKNTMITTVAKSVDEVIGKMLDDQMNEDYIRGQIAKQGVRIGAKELLTGVVTSFKVDHRTTDNGRFGQSTSTEAVLNFQLLLVDVATGKTIASATLSARGVPPPFTTFGVSPDGLATEVANKRAKKAINNWLMTVLPNDFKILKEEVDKKGRPDMVYVKGGEDIGMTKGDDLEVVEIEMLEGTPMKTNIAELTVSEIRGGVSVCKVKKGKDELRSRIDSKADIKVLFKPD